MDKKNNSEQQENYNAEQSSEFYNRPGSTEHNDYRINSKNKTYLPIPKRRKVVMKMMIRIPNQETTGNNN
jgi:hypothetical protein